MKTYLDANIGTLKALKMVIASIDDQEYQHITKPAFQSSLGQHARHIVEHYQCFLKQVNQGKQFNYDLRCRDTRLENNRDICIEEVDNIIAELERFQILDIDVSISDDYSQYGARSSICRELMFLISHTEHHNAMIAAMRRLAGVEVDSEFGVANATLIHEKRVKLDANQGNKTAKIAINES